MTAVVRARVAEEVKDKATEILRKSGLTVSDVIRITLTRIATEEEYVLIPNALTAKTIRDSRKGIGVHTAKNVKELFSDLD